MALHKRSMKHGERRHRRIIVHRERRREEGWKEETKQSDKCRNKPNRTRRKNGHMMNGERRAKIQRRAAQPGVPRDSKREVAKSECWRGRTEESQNEKRTVRKRKTENVGRKAEAAEERGQ